MAPAPLYPMDLFWSDELWYLYLSFWGHFQCEKGAGKGEFQDGSQNGRRALSAALSRFS